MYFDRLFESLTFCNLVLFNIFLFPQTHDINDHDGPLNGKKYNGSFEDEYQKICSLRPRYTIGDCAAGITQYKLNHIDHRIYFKLSIEYYMEFVFNIYMVTIKAIEKKIRRKIEIH